MMDIDGMCIDNLKSYHECLDEISDNSLFEGLLGYGLFAEKIPSFLSSEGFFKFCKSNNPDFKQKNFLYIKYENMRNINVPRLLAIPNPFAYYKQCQILKDNWNHIKKYFRDKTKDNNYKISRIHIRKIYNKKYIFELNSFHYEEANELFRMNYKPHKKDGNPEQNIIIGKKYLIKADISNYFSSIYTHSIPWVLIGKQEAKKDKNKKDVWYNEIDKRTRWLNNNETQGILIGPHTSNLISEIILVSVDNEISKKYQYIRNIDDYSCYVETEEKAKQFLIDLSQELKKFNLSLNHKKTEIIQLPISFDNDWTRKLKLFKLETYSDEGSKTDKINYKTVALLLDTAIELMKENKNNTSILNYTIKILLGYDMSLNAKKYFINIVHHLTLIYPYLIFLLENIFDSKSLGLKIKQISDDPYSKFLYLKIKQISDDIFQLGLKTKNYEAMSYAIYFSLKYDFKLNQKNLLKEAKHQEDCIFMLLCYIYDKKYFKNNKDKFQEYINIAKSFIVQESINLKVLNDEFWLFAYEVLRLEDPNALNVCNDWKQLHDNQISFVLFEKINLIKYKKSD